MTVDETMTYFSGFSLAPACPPARESLSFTSSSSFTAFPVPRFLLCVCVCVFFVTFFLLQQTSARTDARTTRIFSYFFLDTCTILYIVQVWMGACTAKWEGRAMCICSLSSSLCMDTSSTILSPLCSPRFRFSSTFFFCFSTFIFIPFCFATVSLSFRCFSDPATRCRRAGPMTAVMTARLAKESHRLAWNFNHHFFFSSPALSKPLTSTIDFAFTTSNCR